MCSAEAAAFKEAFIVTGFVYLIVIVPLQIWFFTVVLACYRYLRDKLDAATSLPSAYVKQTNPVRSVFVCFDGVNGGLDCLQVMSTAAYPSAYRQQQPACSVGFVLARSLAIIVMQTTATAQPNYSKD